MNEICRSRRSERYGACDDEGSAFPMAAEQRFCNAVKIAKIVCSGTGDPARFHPQRKLSRITEGAKGI